jgi:hypothetical protein
MKIYRVELSRITRLYELVEYDVLKTTAANYLCADRGFYSSVRIPRTDKNVYLDEKAGFLALASALEALHARFLADASSALEALEEAYAGCRGEVSCGWMKPEHVQALQEFARKHGATWKEELVRQWMSGADATTNQDGHLLRQVRNQGGPAWLSRYELP